MKDARTTLIDAIKTRLAQHALPLCETLARLYYRHYEDEELGYGPEGYREYSFRAEIQRFYVWCGFKISYPDAIMIQFYADSRAAYTSPPYTIQFAPAQLAQLQDRGFAYERHYRRWRKRYRLPSPPAGVIDVVVADILWVAQLPVIVRSDAD